LLDDVGVGTITAPVKVVTPVTTNFPPTFTSPPTPSPPVTVIDPVEGLVETVVEFTTIPTDPLNTEFPPTFKFSPIPTPPVITSAPVDGVVDPWLDSTLTVFVFGTVTGKYESSAPCKSDDTTAGLEYEEMSIPTVKTRVEGTYVT
jgi:hypothetical protein